MEILKNKMLPRKYWKDPEIISDFNVTIYRLFFQPEEHGIIKRDIFRWSSVIQTENEFHQHTRWPTKLFSWIGRKYYEIDFYF